MKYTTLHDRMRKGKKKPLQCEICKREGVLDLANISGEYLEDVNDWMFLCRKCHVNFDKKQKKSQSSMMKAKRERNKKYRQENKEKLNDYQRKYYSENKEMINKRARNWRKNRK